MEIWEINLIEGHACISPDELTWLPLWKIRPKGAPGLHYKERRQQKPQEEEIPIQAMVALNISKITALGGINLMISRLGEQIKTLTNQAENPVSQ